MTHVYEYPFEVGVRSRTNSHPVNLNQREIIKPGLDFHVQIAMLNWLESEGSLINEVQFGVRFRIWGFLE